MKGDDACILALQPDLLTDIRRTNRFLRCIHLFLWPPLGDGAPLLGGAGKLSYAFFSVLIFFLFGFYLYGYSTAARPLGCLPTGDALIYAWR